MINLPRLSGPPDAYKTYEVSRPRATHFRKATCREVDCPNFARGWRTSCDVATELGQKQANYIRLHSGRSFTVQAAGDLVTFTFPPGQLCFSQHSVPLDREPFFRIRGGDWRQYGRAALLKPQAWLDDFGDNQVHLKDRIEKG